MKEKPTGPDREDLAWELLKTEHVIRDEWFDVRRCTYRFPDGTVFEPYYSYSKRDYVVIVATDESGNYICVRQFRQGINRVTTEFAAGGLERSGQTLAGPAEVPFTLEEAMAAARRELREETGYESDQWTYLMKVPANATISDNTAFLYMAENCRKVAAQDLDETEFLHVEVLSPEKLERRIRSGRFEQTDHILAWYMARERKQQK
ncbi:MAG: NUDIX hydrolase [Clostridia bacterium]|nr:NUDIX hydrolase [Clostridia bacterium]